jgi:ADP-heptose:LPS heptosyltransferase
MFNYKRTYLLPFKFEIPNYSTSFIKKNSLIKLYLKFIKRYIYIVLQRQHNLEINNIFTTHKKILWINLSAPSIGDSLMDLSNRVLIQDRFVDLYTDKKNAHLYFNDKIFRNVYTQISDLKEINYDLVILDSYSTRTIRIKSKLAPSVSFVGMFGFYNGPEVNRVLFSFHRMNQLLGYIKSEEEINLYSKASISISKKDCQIVRKFQLPHDYISIAIGGEWDYRTYNKWDEVIRILIDGNRNLQIALVGSANALSVARELLEKIPSNNIFDCVDKFSFIQTAEIINKSKILLCCDGGLMHAANSVDTPILALFARLNTSMQLTKVINSFSLYDDHNVNGIEVKNIIQGYFSFINSDNNHPQV